MKQSILIQVMYTCKPGMRGEFYRRIAENRVGELSRQEKGNQKYDYFFPAEEPDKMFLLEIWDSAEDQKVHTTTEHFKKLGEFKSTYVEDTQIKWSCITDYELQFRPVGK